MTKHPGPPPTPDTPGATATPKDNQKNQKNQTAIYVVGAALIMLGLAFASKPLYDTFCRVTGYGGTTQVATAAADRILDRQVRVRFDANVIGAPLEFRPVDRTITAKLGQNVMARYQVTNTSDQPIRAIASYNVAPYKTGRYFQKLQCFCFEAQTYNPGETVDLPVIFYVDPRMDDTRLLDDIHEITLSYTFFLANDDDQFVRATDGRGPGVEG